MSDISNTGGCSTSATLLTGALLPDAPDTRANK